MPIVENMGARLYYEVHGTGHPLIFVHGGGGNTLVWYQQVPHFSKDYKVITIDLRGFKKSACPPDLVHPRFFPDDLRAVMDAEELPAAALVCQSLGAWAGLPSAVRSPDRVSCLFISGSPTPAYSTENWAVLRSSGDIFNNRGFGAGGRSGGVGWNRRFVEDHPGNVLPLQPVQAAERAVRRADDAGRRREIASCGLRGLRGSNRRFGRIARRLPHADEPPARGEPHSRRGNLHVRGRGALAVPRIAGRVQFRRGGVPRRRIPSTREVRHG